MRGRVLYKKNINPIFIFSGVWFSVVFLYSLQWMDILKSNAIDISVFFMAYIYMPFVLGGILAFIIIKHQGVKLRCTLLLDCVIDYKLVRLTLCFFILFSAIECIYYKGVPLFWVLNNDHRGYADYGFPSFHGLLNAIQLSLMLIYFYLAINRKASWLVFFALNFWCVLMLSRFLIMISLVQAFFIYLSFNRVSIKKITLSFILLIVVSFSFGVIGGIRSGIDGGEIKSIFEMNENYPSFLSPDFIWVYAYITTPFNNFVSWAFSGVGGEDYFLPSLLSGLFPTVVRSLIFNEPSVYPPFVHAAFNMSTGYAPILIDTGTLGVIIFNFVIGFFMCLKWVGIYSPLSLFRYVVYLQSLFYLIFFNPFFTLPIIFQLLVLRLFFKRDAVG